MWFKDRKKDGTVPAVVRNPAAVRIVVCRGPSCSERGAAQVLAAVDRALAVRGLRDSVPVFTLSCFGQCGKGPNMVVGARREGWDPILGEAQYFIGAQDEYLYHRLTPAAVEEVIDAHVVRGRPVWRLLADGSGPGGQAGG